MSKRSVEEVVAALEEADRHYYNGTGSISDEEYDFMRDSLRDMAPDHEYLSRVGTGPPEHLKKMKLSMHMGSQNKVQTLEEAKAWFEKAGGGVTTLSDKLDGSSVELTYRGGHLLRAVTRGDGDFGSDITANARKWNGLPLEIRVTQLVHIRGEAMLPIDVWETLNRNAGEEDKTENPRNAANGTILRKSGKNNEHIVFRAFGFHGTTLVNVNTAEARFRFLKDLGFMTPEFLKCDDWEALAACYEFALTARPQRNYEADGVIVELNSLAVQEQLGYSDGGTRPRGQVAWKFPSASGTTRVAGITLSLGHTGAVIPTASLDPVRVAGVTITSVLLNNQDYIKELGLNVGDTVEVERAGDVIPHITRVVQKNTRGHFSYYPGKCPSCGGELEQVGRVILCKSDDCPGQSYKKVMNWIKKLDIKDLGEALLNELVKEAPAKRAVKSIPDLYKLAPTDLSWLQVGNGRLGDSLAQKVINEIARTRTLTVDMFMGSLGIKFLGRSMARKIGLNSPDEYLDISVDDLAAKDGMGPNKARDMKASIVANEKLINTLQAIITVQPLKSKTVPTHTVTKPAGAVHLEGKTVCFTGVRLKGEDLRRFEANGCIEKSGVAKGLDYLVVKDPTSNSGKAVKARQLGVTIMSLEEFVVML